ncbi:MAG TPA: glycosyltransferase, partial [Thermoanaerobaculia bacterium]|nr:glycosyltransferase [Thermoanaerobaculia bacterium]
MSAQALRVLLLSQAPQRRGAEVAAFELGAALLRAGCVVRRLYLYSHAGAAALPLDGGDRVLDGEPAHVFERVPGIHPGVLRRLRREIAAFAPEVVQANGGRTVKYAAAARRLDGAAGWALVYRNIGDPQRWAQGIRALAYRQIVMRQVDGVVSVSATTLAAARSHYGFDGVPAKTIQGGVDPAVLAPRRAAVEVRTSLSTSLEAPVLLFLGNLSAEKRVDRVLDWTAGARREHPNLRLWLVGDGPLRSKLEGRATELGLAENVVFIGRQENVGDYLAAADLLLLASDTEGMPGVVLEAGA